MKINRSSKLYFSKWITKSKQSKIKEFLQEYSKLVNYFIKSYEETIPELQKKDLLLAKYIQQGIKDTNSWLSARAVKNAFSEGYSMVLGAKEASKTTKKQYVSPKQYAKKAILSETNNIQSFNTKTKDFDFNITLGSIGKKLKISIPLKKHEQFNKWNALGTLCKSIVLTDKYIQVTFTVDTGSKKEKEGKQLGIDVGMNKLIATSENNFYGIEIRELLNKLANKKRCSKAYYRLKTQIKEYINYQVKQIPYTELSLIVVEKLKNVKHKMKVKRRLTKSIRRVISNWNYRQVLDRIQALCEENRVSFRSVLPFYTSQECSVCGHRDKGNRLSQELFVCLNCGHSDNADTNASQTILKRFTLGKYGSEFQTKNNFQHS